MSKTGIDLIRRERKQQITKHRFSKARDKKINTDGQLVKGALCCLEKVGRGPGFENVKHPWPEGWDPSFENKIRFKDDIGKLAVAGAFYMAENDRLNESKYDSKILDIAIKIDALLATNPPSDINVSSIVKRKIL